MKRILKWVISFFITLILLIAVFRKVEFGQFLNYLQQAHPLPLLLALLVSLFTNCWLATAKWKYILSHIGLRITFRETFLIKMGCLPLKSVLPLRAGEVSRVLYLKRRHNFSPAKSTASILLELFSNLLVFSLYVVIGGLALKMNPGGVSYFILLFLGGLVLLIYFASRPASRAGIARLLEKIPSPKIRGGLTTLLTIHRYYSYSQLAAIFLYSVIIQSGKLLTFYLITTSFNLPLPLSAYLVLLPLSVLISTVPITLLGLGLREYTLTELITTFTATSAAPVLGAALLFSLVEYIFPVILGFFWMSSFTARMLGGKSNEEAESVRREEKSVKRNGK